MKQSTQLRKTGDYLKLINLQIHAITNVLLAQALQLLEIIGTPARKILHISG